MSEQKSLPAGFIKASRILFVIYLAGLTYFLFFAPFLGRTGNEIYILEGFPLYGDYNLIPFKVIKLFLTNIDKVPFHLFFLNVFGNVLCFLPYGFLLLIASNQKIGLTRTILFAALNSAIFEFLQFLFAVGTGDIDDVILNTAGAIAGYGIGKLIISIKDKKKHVKV